MTAEKYHLKWDAHQSFLNSTVSTLYKNEKFADVVLYCSKTNGNGTIDRLDTDSGLPFSGVLAHKVILSSCSQFFATMFDNMQNATFTGGMLYVVLPTELSYRAIQILVQYMYCGEATVSHDILNEVLRGGEILKIRGLSRTSSSSSSSNLEYKQCDSATCTSSCTHYNKNKKRLLQPHHQQQQQQSAHLPEDFYAGSNHLPKNKHRNTRFINENPQKPNQIQEMRASSIENCLNLPQISQQSVQPREKDSKNMLGARGISVNKDVAIDPENINCYSAQSHKTATQSVLKNMTENCMKTCCQHYVAVAEEQGPTRRDIFSVATHTPIRCPDRGYDDHSDDEYMNLYNNTTSITHNDTLYFPQNEQCEQIIKSAKQRSPSPRPTPTMTPPPAHSPKCISVKKEPEDWSTFPSHVDRNVLGHPMASLNSPDSDGNVMVKYEIDTSLGCDMRKEGINSSEMCAHHLQINQESPNPDLATHSTTTSNFNSDTQISSNKLNAQTKLNAAKKRRRVSENNVDHVTLLCDLCSVPFETPADWVRHMNSQHTEIELALYNNDQRHHKQKRETKCLNSCVANTTQPPTRSNSQKNYHCDLAMAKPTNTTYNTKQLCTTTTKA